LTLYSLLKGIMRRMRCHDCGAPWMASRLVNWTADGLIKHNMLGYDPPPSIIIEVEEFSNIFQSLEQALGFSIGHIVTESERKATLGWFGTALDIFPGFMLKSNLLAGLLWNVTMLFLDHSGQGHQEMVRVGDRTNVLYVGRNLFYLPAAAGDRQATSEALFGRKYRVSGIDLGDENYVVACTASEAPTGVEDRLEYISRQIIGGSVEFSRCPSCGVPRQANNYTWGLDNGTITNRLTGLREMLLANWSIDVICREIAEELGEEIERIIIEAERDFTADRLAQFGMRLSHSGLTEFKGNDTENMRILLDDLPFRGMGYVESLSLENDELRLRVNNPLNEALLSGKVLGYYETLLGKKGKVNWSTPDGEWAVEIEIEPA